MKNIIFIILSSLIGSSVFCQYSNANWVFGNNAGITFNQMTGGYPTAFSGSQVSTEEGIACISDENGTLLFYTDGYRLWDYNHVLITNTLKGDYSSTQSAIIVPNPALVNNSRDYYVFTVDAWGACSWTNPVGHGIYYNIINVNFNTPYTVTVVQENIPLKNNISFRENLMAVSKPNMPGYWVISKQYAETNTTGNNAFYVWEVTSAGVDTVPQIYNVGSIQNPAGTAPGNPTGNASIGYLKISPNGSILAMANNHLNYVELYRFNPTTGAVLPFVTTGNTVLTGITRAYGLVFSPDNRFLYVSRTYNGTIQQFDLTSTNIATSGVVLTPTLTGSTVINGALQLGPDNKIYVARYNQGKLAVINDPNSLGNACNLVDNAVQLSAGSSGQAGLPTFVPTKIQTVDLPNELNALEIGIYPNPCGSYFNIDYPSGFSVSISISNVQGQVVHFEQLNFKQHTVDISDLPSAIYAARIDFIKNNKIQETVIRKIVKGY